MGWYFGYASRKDVIADLTKDTDTCHTLRRYTSGNTLWTVQEVVKTGERFIGCYLMQGGRSQDWGYKPMEESMGPCETTCPPIFFSLVADPGGYATEWRKRVLSDHARRNMRLAKGDVIVLTNGKTYHVTTVRPLRGLENGSGMAYRIPRKMLVRKTLDPLDILRETATKTELDSPAWNTLVHAAQYLER